jgi:Na+-translocating ferredoxin:NAD+ oxidoreductase RnfG subunit
MDGWIRWSAPAAAIAVAFPAYSYQYSTVGAAQQQAFPGARFEEIQPQRVWKALVGGRVTGYFFVDHVIGKHLYIDYSVALDASGRVRRVEILTYRESYGFEVANAGWLSQFTGKSSGSALAVGQDIRNISGATLSSRHVTEGVKRILAYYASHLR